jgi:alpha-1,2-mannosyltransferase
MAILARLRCARWAVPVALAALIGHALVLLLWPDAHLLLIDLQVYRAGAEHLLAAQPLYAGPVLGAMMFVYPPFAALLVAPLTAVPVPVLNAAWTAGSLLLLGAVVRRCLQRAGVPAPLPVVVALVLAATWLDPVRTTLYLGQVNLVLLALVALDVLGPAQSRWRGIGIGLAAAVKLTPLLFVVYLLVTGRIRAALTALATFVVAAGLGFLLAPADSVDYWLRGTFAAAGRISPADALSNHALTGTLVRRLGEVPVLPLAASALVVVCTLLVARLAHRAGEEVLAAAVCGLGAAAAAPFAWSHHYVWIVPLVLALAVRPAGRWLAAGVVVATAAVITRLPGPGVGPIPATGLVSLWPDTYAVLTLLVLAAVAVLCRRRAGTPAEVGASG